MHDPVRFRQIDSLFDAALEMPAGERAAWLDQACGGDTALRTEVEALLASVLTAESAFGENVAEYAAPLLADLPAEARDDTPLPAGQLLGAWRIVQPLGRGGMGAVYLAERADGAFERKAAIKVVKRGMDTAEVLRRFREERRILGSLDHPNVARLLDGGASPDGRPYLVMEYVEGQRIDEWCDGRRLRVRERVRLFRDVCEAVHQAHRRLVVHRDVKPSNVLVTADGTPKLLDFGIAKLLDTPDAAETRTGFRLLTPEYAAPEQLEGQPVTTATDVYALGRLLHELLTGARPRGAAKREAAGPALPPSQTVLRAGDTDPVTGRAGATIAAARDTTVDRLRAELRGDLDVIVLRAMAAGPARRYGSAQQLAEDLDRWLNGMPVSARRDSVAYRTSRFVRRHPAGVGTAAAFVLLLIVFAVWAAAAQRQTAAALVRAENERDTAEEVATLLENLLTAGDPTALRPERLDTFRIAALLDRSNARVRAELADRPLAQARLLRAIGDTYRGLGNLDSAASLLTSAVSVARGTDDTRTLADALNSLGLVQLQRGASASAEPFLLEALELRVATRPGDMDVVQSLNNLAVARQNQADFDSAAALYASAMAAMRASPAPDTQLLTALLNGQAMLAQRMGDYELAAVNAARIVELDRARLGPVHSRVALGLVNVGLVTMRLGRLAEADSLIGAGLAMFAETVGTEHPMYLTALASAANVRAMRGRFVEARQLFEEALVSGRRVWGRSPDLAITLSNYADALAADNALAEAHAAAAEAWAINRDALGAGHPDTGITRSFVARLDCRLGRDGAAVAGFRDALSTIEQALPPTHPRVIAVRSDYSRCLTQLERYKEAEATLMASFEALGGSAGGADVPAPARAVAARLAEVYEAWGRGDLAATWRAAADTTSR